MIEIGSLVYSHHHLNYYQNMTTSVEPPGPLLQTIFHVKQSLWNSLSNLSEEQKQHIWNALGGAEATTQERHQPSDVPRTVSCLGFSSIPQQSVRLGICIEYCASINQVVAYRHTQHGPTLCHICAHNSLDGPKPVAAVYL